MTELEKIKRAKMYIEQLANGIDPISGNELASDTILNNVRLARCFFYTAEILQWVINKGGPSKVSKKPFEIPEINKDLIPLSDAPLPVTYLCNNINSAVDLDVYKKLPATRITGWLVKEGFLEEIQTEEGKRKIPTEKSDLIGITSEEKISWYTRKSYIQVLYSKQAQQFVIDNLDEILKA